MYVSLLALLFLAETAELPSDVARRCRDAHENDPPARIACLEEALGNRAPEPRSAGIGAEQVEARQRSRESESASATVAIESVRYDAQQRGVFRLADGQVWRETEVSPRHTRLVAGRRYTARIERGQLGGYRMFVEGSRRMIKVERLE